MLLYQYDPSYGRIYPKQRLPKWAKCIRCRKNHATCSRGKPCTRCKKKNKPCFYAGPSTESTKSEPKKRRPKGAPCILCKEARVRCSLGTPCARCERQNRACVYLGPASLNCELQDSRFIPQDLQANGTQNLQAGFQSRPSTSSDDTCDSKFPPKMIQKGLKVPNFPLDPQLMSPLFDGSGC